MSFMFLVMDRLGKGDGGGEERRGEGGWPVWIVMRFTQWGSYCRKQFPDLAICLFSLCCRLPVCVTSGDGDVVDVEQLQPQWAEIVPQLDLVIPLTVCLSVNAVVWRVSLWVELPCWDPKTLDTILTLDVIFCNAKFFLLFFSLYVDVCLSSQQQSEQSWRGSCFPSCSCVVDAKIGKLN